LRAIKGRCKGIAEVEEDCGGGYSYSGGKL